MFLFKNKSIFSRTFLIFVLLLNFANFVLNDKLYLLFRLDTNAILQKLEVWRLITYPIIFSNFESFLIFCFTFLFISTRLERIIDTFRYPVWLFIISLMQGLAITLLFWKSNISLVGLDGLCFFILILYTLLEPKAKVEIVGDMSINSSVFAILISLAWVISNISNIGVQNLVHFLPQLSSVLFGVTFGILIYSQIKINQRIFYKKRKAQFDALDIPKPEELSMAMLQNVRSRRANYRTYEDIDNSTEILSDDPEENEEKLNTILDKINSKGKESLTEFEQTFLVEYSKSIQ